MWDSNQSLVYSLKREIISSYLETGLFLPKRS
jgi:hypothetical protein